MHKIHKEWIMQTLPQVAIIELGSQYTLLIERALRELGFRSVILDPSRAEQWLQEHHVKAVILSGGAASVYDRDAPQPPFDILRLRQVDGGPIAVLGICYGMQWIAAHEGGTVRPIEGSREYGDATIRVKARDGIFAETPTDQPVWMSHGDSVTVLPEGFTELAVSDGAIAAMQRGLVWGVQFHPEVTHTPHGKQLLGNFLRLAGCETDWIPTSIVERIRDEARTLLRQERVVFGFSGGVDSTTVSAILAPVLRDRLRAVAIDGGQLREGEREEIEQHARAAGVNLVIVDAHEEFQAVMRDTVDAEEKRRRFRNVYTSLFVRAAREFGAAAVLQGTLAPDRIESGATGGAVIKSHHNVGLDMGKLRQWHPVDHLFKYEVRALAQAIGLPPTVWQRQPFPGPGLFVRVVGVPATLARLEIVRWADARVREILVRHGRYDELAQLVVAYVGAHTVGVKGDARVYGGSIVVRAVSTADFMTAEGVWFPKPVVDDVKRVLTAHSEIVRVWFDPTNKPPATTELE